MRQNVEKAGLGVPGFNGGRSDDDALHALLARANLMRLRGEYGEAEKICLTALEHHPDSASVHTLLGDIAFSQDQAEKAAQHYEIAEQIDPSAGDIPRKLAEAKAMSESKDSATTAEQLGLPTKPAIPWTSLGFGVIAALALGGALVAGLAAYPRNGAGRAVAAPIVATPDMVANVGAKKPAAETATPSTKPVESSEASTSGTEPAPSTPANPPSTAPAAVASLDDQNLLEQMRQRSSLGGHILALTSDPRTKLVTVTFSLSGQEEGREVGAELAKSVLDHSGDTLTVTVRAIRDQRLVYMADVPRSRYADTIVDSWQQNNPDREAWLTHVLTNEWPYRSESASKAP